LTRDLETSCHTLATWKTKQKEDEDRPFPGPGKTRREMDLKENRIFISKEDLNILKSCGHLFQSLSENSLFLDDSKVFHAKTIGCL